MISRVSAQVKSASRRRLTRLLPSTRTSTPARSASTASDPPTEHATVTRAPRATSPAASPMSTRSAPPMCSESLT